MLYLPKLKTKILLILLSGLLSFHFCFLSSKSLTASSDDYRIVFASEEQYQNFLKTISDKTISDRNFKADFILNTRATYIFNLPEEFSLFFFPGYFLIASGFILFSKLNSNNTDDEKS